MIIKERENKQTQSIVGKAEDYVTELFKKELPDALTYHNLTHTAEVADIAVALAQKSDVTDEELETLVVAAWLHDTGYIKKYRGHEEESLNYANDFFSRHKYSEEKKEHVARLIMSTVAGYEPTDKLERLLHDADLAHLGRKRFFRKGELLRVEFENYSGKACTEQEWAEMQYDFLIRNHFLSQAGKERFNKRRVKNIEKQRQNILKAQKVTVRTQTGKDFGRGIDTLYRANYRNHINLSAIADGKANMMISINTILISVIITFSGASLSISADFMIENLRFTIPILTLLIGALISVVFAVLSARPKVTTKDVDKQEVEKNKISLLYFGIFLRVPREEFVTYLNKLKEDQSKLYDSMSIDIYNLGLVLREKYRLLTISYNVFMFGLTLTVLAFLFIFFYTNA